MYHEIVRFEWDPKKAKRILKKQGVSFEEAGTGFSDPLLIISFFWVKYSERCPSSAGLLTERPGLFSTWV